MFGGKDNVKIQTNSPISQFAISSVISMQFFMGSGCKLDSWKELVTKNPISPYCQRKQNEKLHSHAQIHLNFYVWAHTYTVLLKLSQNWAATLEFCSSISMHSHLSYSFSKEKAINYNHRNRRKLRSWSTVDEKTESLCLHWSAVPHTI